jgi:glc operon protein GlcG
MDKANASAPATAATYFAKDKVTQAMTSGTALYNGKIYRVQMGRRTEPGQVEVHTKDSDVFYIVEGSGTFVTGGTMVGGKSTGPGEFRGTSITGGETHHLTKGDVIVIPDSVPHWWQQIQEPVIYFTVKEVTGH